MAFQLKDIIFNLFGVNDKRRDSNKDSNGRGTLQRYNELLAEDFDDNTTELINGLLDNTLVPQSSFERFIPYLEEMLGGGVLIADTIESRRKVLQHLLRIYQIKGTKKGYEVLYKMMGFDSVEFTEFFGDSGFDSPTTFDDEERVFDGGCPSCTGYIVDIIGTIPITNPLIKFIFNVITFNQPINAILRGVTYNGEPINSEIIIIFVNNNGDLIYDNQYSPGTILTLVDGDLFIDGTNETRYSINSDGDLIFT